MECGLDGGRSECDLAVHCKKGLGLRGQNNWRRHTSLERWLILCGGRAFPGRSSYEILINFQPFFGFYEMYAYINFSQ